MARKFGASFEADLRVCTKEELAEVVATMY